MDFYWFCIFFLGNHAVRLLGKGFVVIHSTADFSCSSIGTEKIFGFMYKQKSSNVTTYFNFNSRSILSIKFTG